MTLKTCTAWAPNTFSVIWLERFDIKEHVIKWKWGWTYAICFDALSKEEEPTDYSISSIIRNTFDLSVSFVSCKFCWIKKSLNSTAHSAAKHAVAFKVGFSCNICNLPPPILEAYRQDCCTAFYFIFFIYLLIFFYLVFNEMVVYPKKKKKDWE